MTYNNNTINNHTINAENTRGLSVIPWGTYFMKDFGNDCPMCSLKLSAVELRYIILCACPVDNGGIQVWQTYLEVMNATTI